MASTVGEEEAGNQEYQQGHLALMFREGLSFSGFERNSLFLNLDGKGFREISGVSGVDSVLDGRAVVVADFDNDGDLDVFVTTIQGEGHLLYRNNVGQDKGFLRVTLKGTASGRDAFGAVVRVKTSRGIQTQVKSGGSGFLAQPDPRLLFGLGEDREVEWLEVTWPSGKVKRIGPLKAGQSIEIVEGDEGHRQVAERRTNLPDPLSPLDRFWAGLAFEKGTALPALQLEPVTGSPQSDRPVPAPGRRSFLNLWATWCAPCIKEMPELEKLRPEFEAAGIELLGISLDQDVPPETIRRFAERTGVSYPLYRLDESQFEKIFAGERVFIPLSILLDEEGKATDIFVGWNAETERRLHRLLR